jgi:hypothetical protein
MQDELKIELRHIIIEVLGDHDIDGANARYHGDRDATVFYSNGMQSLCTHLNGHWVDALTFGPVAPCNFT